MERLKWRRLEGLDWSGRSQRDGEEETQGVEMRGEREWNEELEAGYRRTHTHI